MSFIFTIGRNPNAEVGTSMQGTTGNRTSHVIEFVHENTKLVISRSTEECDGSRSLRPGLDENGIS